MLSDDPPAASLRSRRFAELEKTYRRAVEKSKSYLEFDEKDIESDEALWALYERWCRFQRVRRSRSEMARRFSRFKHVAHFVHTTNNANLSYEVGLGKFADQEKSEICGCGRSKSVKWFSKPMV
jgi:hypothetical protein